MEKNIRRICERTGTGEADAYSSMLITAALMDLRTDDERVAEMVLKDGGYVDLR